MKFLQTLLVLNIMVVAFTASAFAGDRIVVEDAKKPEYLYVMSSKSGTFINNTLTLKDVATVVFFSNRPNRIAGHVTPQRFVEEWDKGISSMKSDPPNATLSILEGDMVKNVVVTLIAPFISGDTITFKVEPLDGKLPAEFGRASLFIDASGAGLGYGIL